MRDTARRGLREYLADTWPIPAFVCAALFFCLVTEGLPSGKDELGYVLFAWLGVSQNPEPRQCSTQAVSFTLPLHDAFLLFDAPLAPSHAHTHTGTRGHGTASIVASTYKAVWP